MHKSATKCNETLSKWCKNKHGASKIIDTLETYHIPTRRILFSRSSSPKNLQVRRGWLEVMMGDGPGMRMSENKVYERLVLVWTSLEL
jgi:hypothetical protein